MATLRQIRQRIRSIRNTAKITRAMEMVAASKMRRAQQMVLASRPYAEKMVEVLGDLAARTAGQEDLHPLLVQRPVQRVALLHITPDRGLSGPLNTNINRRSAQFILDQAVPVQVVTVGRKGRDFMLRYGREVIAEFTGLGDRPSLLDTLPISHILTEGFAQGTFDRVVVGYARFVSTVIQRPVLEELLPIQPPEGMGSAVDYIYEPDAASVLAELLPRYVEMQVYHAVLESLASEQSARMVAMHSATENANEVIGNLTLTYNKVRQEAITKELLDLVGGSEALAKAQGG